MDSNENGVDVDEIILAQHPHLRPRFYQLGQTPIQLLPITVGALIDSDLRATIAAKLAPCETTNQLLEPMPYAAIVRLARSLGLITKPMSLALLKIGHLRNHFAHNADASVNDSEAGKPLVAILKLMFEDMGGINPDEPAYVALTSDQPDPEARHTTSQALLIIMWLICATSLEQVRKSTEQIKALDELSIEPN